MNTDLRLNEPEPIFATSYLGRIQRVTRGELEAMCENPADDPPVTVRTWGFRLDLGRCQEPIFTMHPGGGMDAPPEPVEAPSFDEWIAKAADAIAEAEKRHR
jgi:hypothetical protein